MNSTFECVVSDIISRTQERYSMSNQPIGAWFEKNICICRTTIIDESQRFYDNMRAGRLSTLSDLKDEKYFNNSYFESKALCALFWSFQKTVLDHWDLLTRTNAFEEVQNSSLFASLSSNLSMMSCLDKSIKASGDFFLYSADCKSDSTESRLGTDFGIIIPIANDKYKVALFQAKKANHDEATSIERESPGGSHYQQLTRMLDVEKPWLTEDTYEPSQNPEYEGSLFGRLCFYVFWHDPRTYLLPTILSAIQANHQIEKNTGVSYLEKGSTKVSVRKSDMNIAPLCGGTWFSEAISLLLTDPQANFGIEMTKEDICELLESETAKPRQILGVRIPSNTLNLGDWRDIFPEKLVENEKFFLDGKEYIGREEFNLAKPQPGKSSPSEPAP
ncbi:hypothetical protein [Acetobacter fabarum]|uniref:hypothetical protein n=1 Tax=Acetobacter fabarum TaxID=483199 RepID=UPI00209EAD68|nr:hypothetical protein [Acetobacter fabarum]MCP1229392.1 hypothetical protein [Acetobacter fabarum]MCP1234908.1 hypothetical protein [Acetobacter fabarum]